MALTTDSRCSVCGILFDLPARYNVVSGRAGDGRCLDCQARGLTEGCGETLRVERHCLSCGVVMRASKPGYCNACLHRGVHVCIVCGERRTNSLRRICRKCGG